MKQWLLLILFAFISGNLVGQNKRIDSLQDSKLERINKSLLNLENKIEVERGINDKTFNSISTQISVSSYVLTIMGIAFAIVAIGVGVYVTYVERKIIKIGEENKALLTKNQKIKQDVEDLNALIQSDIYGLFNKIKRQETVDILSRLEQIPKDISNVCSLLLSRELLEMDFEKLRKAYLSLGEREEEYKTSYKILFFQHFLTQTMIDTRLRQDMLRFIPDGIFASFENDIIKSIKDFITAVINKGLNNYQDEINKFFSGISASNHRAYQLVYTTFFDSLKTRQNRFALINIVQSTKENRIAKIAFGKLLIAEYSNKEPTEVERLTMGEIEELENQQLKEDNEAKEKAEAQKRQREEQHRKREEQQRQRQG